MIEFKDVHLQYPYDEFELLKGVSFTFTDGINVLLADTQSGKTSICRLLLKEVSATSGQIYVDGKEISSITNANLDILYLPNNPVFFEKRSILYNIAYPLKVRKADKRQRLAIALQRAERFGFDVKERVNKLSLERRKILAIARGTTVERKIVIWDDFFEGCSPDSVRNAFSLFNATHICVTSDPKLAMGNAVVLDGGKTVFQGNAETARQKVQALQWLADSLRSN